jgi:hypothetical protein
MITTHKATEGPGRITALCPRGGYQLAERWKNVDCPSCLALKPKRRVKVYWDFSDWWVGLYIGPNHLYMCFIPTLVVRVRR